MLDRLGKFIVDKYFDPCKKCLVKAICKPNWRKCDDYSQYLDHRYNARNKAQFWVLLTLVVSELLFIITILGYGKWEWFKSIL